MTEFKVTRTVNAPSEGPQPEPIALEMGKPTVIRTYGSDLTIEDLMPPKPRKRAK